MKPLIASRPSPPRSLTDKGPSGSSEPVPSGAGNGKPIKLAYLTHLPITQWLFLKGQNQYMAEHGMELHSLSSPGSRLEELGRRDNMAVSPVSIARTISPFRDLWSLIRLCRLLRRIRPDVLHLSTPKAALLGAIAAKLVGGAKTVFLVRGFTSAQTQGWSRRLYRRLERLTVKLSDVTICNAPSLLHYGREAGILDETQGQVLLSGMSNGIDLKHFDPESVAKAALTLPRPNGDGDWGPVVGFVGRLAQDKGIEILADAWRTLREEFPNAVLLLVGPWETRDRVSAAVREALAADPRVVLTGAADDVRPYLKWMDVFAFPSFGEGFPNAPMEAAAFRIPVITTDAVGCVDAVEDGVTGTIIPTGDVPALTDAVRTYFRDRELREAHGREGRLRIQREFNQTPIWEAFRRLYLELVSEREAMPGPRTPMMAEEPAGRNAGR